MTSSLLILIVKGFSSSFTFSLHLFALVLGLDCRSICSRRVARACPRPRTGTATVPLHGSRAHGHIRHRQITHHISLPSSLLNATFHAQVLLAWHVTAGSSTDVVLFLACLSWLARRCVAASSQHPAHKSKPPQYPPRPSARVVLAPSPHSFPFPFHPHTTTAWPCRNGQHRPQRRFLCRPPTSPASNLLHGAPD